MAADFFDSDDFLQDYAADALVAQNILEQQPTQQQQPTESTAFGTINQFKSHIMNYGVARPNMFLAVIAAPVEQTKLLEYTSLMCKSADFPPTILMTRERLTYGVGIELPYAREHQPVSLEFYVDNLYSAKCLFDDWTSFITDYSLSDPMQSTHDVEFFSNYSGTVTLYQMHASAPDAEDKCVYAIQLNECYPQQVIMSGFGHDQLDAQHTLRVVFNYTSMHIVKINTGQILTDMPPVRQQMYDAAGLNDKKFNQNTGNNLSKQSEEIKNLFNTNLSSSIGAYVEKVPTSQFNNVTQYFKGI